MSLSWCVRSYIGIAVVFQTKNCRIRSVAIPHCFIYEISSLRSLVFVYSGLELRLVTRIERTNERHHHVVVDPRSIRSGGDVDDGT